MISKLLDELEAEEASAKYNGIQWYGLKQAIEIVRKHTEGKVLVPVEPTEAMLSACVRDGEEYYLPEIAATARRMYQAMLKAAEGKDNE